MPPQHSARLVLRARRRALSPQTQSLHSTAVARRIGATRQYLGAARVGIYWPTDGEIDPRALMDLPQGRSKHFFLPVLQPFGLGDSRRRLWWSRYHPGARMTRNRFSIPEPAARGASLARLRTLDLVVVPLVGFDADCHRIGMGAGYYDRTLKHLLRLRRWRRPRLIGAAHECQRIEPFTPAPWDIPLDLIATERTLYAGSSPLPGRQTTPAIMLDQQTTATEDST